MIPQTLMRTYASFKEKVRYRKKNLHKVWEPTPRSRNTHKTQLPYTNESNTQVSHRRITETRGGHEHKVNQQTHRDDVRKGMRNMRINNEIGNAPPKINSRCKSEV